MMQHLNYCRQMVKQFNERLQIPNLPNDHRQFVSHVVDLANASQKFLLPKGGLLYEDPDYRALDDSERLFLPFPFIALEFTESDAKARIPKAIIFARERDDVIALTVATWVATDGRWIAFPEATIPRVGYLGRKEKEKEKGEVWTPFLIKLPDQLHVDALAPYGVVLLSFLNVLRCSNVHIERSEPKKAGKVKTALPFDAYHILTIDLPGKATAGSGALGSHRSPREHLRRGHIRRLADGRRIWVNATVVGAGHGAGVISKDYALRNRPSRPEVRP